MVRAEASDRLPTSVVKLIVYTLRTTLSKVAVGRPPPVHGQDLATQAGAGTLVVHRSVKARALGRRPC